MGEKKFDIYGPEFQALRPLVLERDEHRCCACNHDGSVYRLEVHHRCYVDPPQLSHLYTFCQPCHDVWTNFARKMRYRKRVPPVAQPKRESPRARPEVEKRPELKFVEKNDHRPSGNPFAAFTRKTGDEE